MIRTRRRWSMVVAGVAVAAAIVGLPIPAPADPTTGSLAGHLTDAGAPVPDASVYLSDSNDNFVGSTSTDADGAYTFADVAAGSYRVTFNLAGGLTQYAHQHLN